MADEIDLYEIKETAPTLQIAWRRIRQLQDEIGELDVDNENLREAVHDATTAISEYLQGSMTQLLLAEKVVTVRLRAFIDSYDKYGILDAISQLARIDAEAGPEKAASHFFEFCNRYAQFLFVDLSSAMGAIAQQFEWAFVDRVLVRDILARRWQVLVNASDLAQWDATVLLARLGRIEDQSVAVYESRLELFPRSRKLLQACVRRRMAFPIAMRVTGQYLPAELVEAVVDRIYSEEQLAAEVMELSE